MTEAQIVIRLIDRFSADLDSIKKSIASFGENATRSIRNTQTQFSSFSKTVASSASSFVKSMALMGAATFGLQKGITTLIDFDNARARAVGLAGFKGDDIKELTSSALKIGGSTEFSGTDIMNAYAVNSRTIKDIETLKKVTSIQTDLATVGGVAVTTIADATVGIISSFGLAKEGMQEFGDDITLMMQRNSQSITSNLEALGRVAPALKGTGNDIKDTIALLTPLGSILNVEGGELGGILKTAIGGLIDTARLARTGNKEDSSVLRQLGLSPDDIDLSKHKLIDVFDTINKHLNGRAITVVEANALFGGNSTLAASSILEQVGAMRKMREELNNTDGGLFKASSEMRKTIGANLGNAIGAVDSLIVKLGDAGLKAAIISAAKAFETFFNFLANSPFIVSLITNVLIAVTALWSLKKITGLLTIAWGFLRTQILVTRVAMLLAGGGVNALKIGFLGLRVAIKGLFMANPLGWIFVALQALYELYNLWKKFTSESSTPQAEGGKSTPKNGAFWQGGDGKMTPYTPQSKQTVQSDVNINISGLPKGATVEAQQRGASGMNVGTTNISYAGMVGSLF
jgi:TP901 family phage tail tape measure protein